MNDSKMAWLHSLVIDTTKEMQGCELLCEMVVPMMERTIGWADDSWAFRLWKSNPSNVMLEYMTFREIAL